MKLTCLIENRGPEGLLNEHGLSIWIEHRDRVLLLDSGSTPRFSANANALGLSLARVDEAVLSHGHYDHAGGFVPLFSKNPDVKVHIRAGADGENCADHGQGMKFIGISRELLHRYGHRFVSHSGVTELGKGVWLVPDGVPNLTQRSLRAGMFRKEGDNYIPEDFCHEQSLVLEGEAGLVVLNSCSHAGVPGILRTVMDLFPGKAIQAFIGGFHMMGPGGAETLGWTEEAVVAEAETLKELPVGTYYTCHCTGLPAFHLLKQVLGDRVVYFQTGDTIELC